MVTLGVKDVIDYYTVRHLRPRECARAVYYHAEMAVHIIKEVLVKFDEMERRISADASTYTPFIVASQEDNLTYDQIITVMALLKQRKKPVPYKPILYFYYYHNSFDAHVQSFNTEYVRSYFSQKRKNELLAGCREIARGTIIYAEDTMKVLSPFL